MARKTHFAGAAAIAATLGVTFASAELSGANAQQGIETEAEIQIQNPPSAITDETVPVVFVSEPIIQPLPAPDTQVEAVPENPVQGGSVRQASSLNELVGMIDTSVALSDEMECLAGAVYFEARGEPLAGQLAVAQVVINRSEDRRFPSSYCGVVFQRSQFSFVKNGSMPKIKRGSDAWERAKAISRIAHEGQWDSTVQDSLYFHAKYVKPKWSYRKAKRATINTHIFYR